jgi:hypothetical protein
MGDSLEQRLIASLAQFSGSGAGEKDHEESFQYCQPSHRFYECATQLGRSTQFYDENNIV